MGVLPSVRYFDYQNDSAVDTLLPTTIAYILCAAFAFSLIFVVFACVCCCKRKKRSSGVGGMKSTKRLRITVEEPKDVSLSSPEITEPSRSPKLNAVQEKIGKFSTPVAAISSPKRGSSSFWSKPKKPLKGQAEKRFKWRKKKAPRQKIEPSLEIARKIYMAKEWKKGKARPIFIKSQSSLTAFGSPLTPSPRELISGRGNAKQSHPPSPIPSTDHPQSSPPYGEPDHGGFLRDNSYVKAMLAPISVNEPVVPSILQRHVAVPISKPQVIDIGYKPLMQDDDSVTVVLTKTTTSAKTTSSAGTQLLASEARSSTITRATVSTAASMSDNSAKPASRTSTISVANKRDSESSTVKKSAKTPSRSVSPRRRRKRPRKVKFKSNRR